MIEKFSVWELDGKYGWKSLLDIYSCVNNFISWMMCFV